MVTTMGKSASNVYLRRFQIIFSPEKSKQKTKTISRMPFTFALSHYIAQHTFRALKNKETTTRKEKEKKWKLFKTQTIYVKHRLIFIFSSFISYAIIIIFVVVVVVFSYFITTEKRFTSTRVRAHTHIRTHTQFTGRNEIKRKNAHIMSASERANAHTYFDTLSPSEIRPEWRVMWYRRARARASVLYFHKTIWLSMCRWVERL